MCSWSALELFFSNLHSTGGREGAVGCRGGKGGGEGPAEAVALARGSREVLQSRGQRWRVAEAAAATWTGHRCRRVVGIRTRQHRALHTEDARRRLAV